MAGKDNDDLARLLSGMADGEYAQESPHEGQEHDSIDAAPAPPVAPAPMRPTPQPQSPAAKPVPRVVPKSAQAAPRPTVPKPTLAPAAKPAAMPPKPAVIQAKPVAPVARPVVVKPAAPPAAIVRPPVTPAPEPQPAPTPDAADTEAGIPAPQMVVPEPDEMDVEVGEIDDDDAVIVPAPSVESLAHTPRRHKHNYTSRQHFVQSATFQRAMIPVSFSLGLICSIYVILGLLSPADSPFVAFRKSFIPYVLGLLAMVMLAIGILTMLQVRNQISRAAARETRQPPV
jgi:hypothetical protein